MQQYLKYHNYLDVDTAQKKRYVPGGVIIGGDWPFVHFTPKEMACRHTNQLVVSIQFMARLEGLRERLGFPLDVTSGYRDPEYNDQVSGTGLDGPHTTGHAADIAIWGHRAYSLVYMAAAMGMTGVGVRQTGLLEKRFIHLDDLPASEYRPRPTLWSY